MFPVHPCVEVASTVHVDELVDMWSAAREELGAVADRGEGLSAEERVRGALDRPGVRVYVARLGADAVGFVALSRADLTGLSAATGLWVDMLYVRPDARKRGVAHLLLSAVERHARGEDVDQLVVLAPTQARDTNRFLARLGFASRMALRVSTPDELRLRLVPEAEQAQARAVQRRRSLLRARKRQILGGEHA